MVELKTTEKALTIQEEKPIEVPAEATKIKQSMKMVEESKGPPQNSNDGNDP